MVFTLVMSNEFPFQETSIAPPNENYKKNKKVRLLIYHRILGFCQNVFFLNEI